MTTDTGNWVGQLLDGRYQVTTRLGAGGMGFVYRAKDTRLDCDVVVKVPRAAALEDAGFRERFRDEVGALVRLAHPHVVKVSDFGQHGGVPFAVMQFLPGGSLEDRRPRDPDGRPRAVAHRTLAGWLAPVAEALDFIHKQGYVHRDVKPANILFDAHKNPYVSDFGVAKAVTGAAADRRGLTGTGLVLGTPEYMAPELVLGQKFDGRIDQYALAVMVYELLTGEPPLTGPNGTAVLVKQSTEVPRPLAEVRPGIPATLSAAVAKALEKDPRRRFPDCATFAKAVLTALGEAPAAPAKGKGVPTARPANPSAVETPRPQAAVGTPPTATPTPLASQGRAPAGPRSSESGAGLNWLWIGLGGGALLLVLGFLAWKVLHDRGAPPSPSGANPPPVAVQPSVPNPPPVTVTALRPITRSLELTAGGPAQALEVVVERTGDGRVQVEVEAPPGVEARPAAVLLAPDQKSARVELSAAPTAVAQPNAVARVRARAANEQRATIPVTIRRLDFRASLMSDDEVVLIPGRRQAVEVRIDRAGGYTGPLTLSLAETPALAAATVDVPAGATQADLPLDPKPNAPAGSATVRVRVATPSAGPDHDLAFPARTLDLRLVRSFAGHAGRVQCVTLSADGRLALSGGADGTLRLWDVATGQERWKADAHTGGVLSAVFSPDGKQVLSGGADLRLRLWEAVTGKLVREFDKQHEREIWLVRYIDGIATSTAADHVVRWDTATGRVRMVGGRRDFILNTIVGAKPHISPGVSPGPEAPVVNEAGSFALSGLGSITLDLWKRGDEDRPVARLTGADEAVRAMAVSADGRRVLAYADDKTLRLWATDTPPAVPPRPSAPTKAKARGKAKAKAPPPLVPRNDGTPQLTDSLDWESDTAVSCVALDADGRHALLGNADGLLQLWRLPP